MIRVLFVCHGNICRSPMAEFIMKDIVRRNHRENDFYIESAATSSEEIYRGVGNPLYPPAKKKLREEGIECEGHQARRMERSDYDRFDYLIAMENYNVRNMMRILGNDPEKKITRLLDWTDSPKDISDPWYSDDFDTAYDEIEKGCRALFLKLK